MEPVRRSSEVMGRGSYQGLTAHCPPILDEIPDRSKASAVTPER
jgi:hypothetical protein